MTKRFSYTLLRGWEEAGGQNELPELKGLEPHQRLLLLSDGSLTLDLELLFGAAVEVDVMHEDKTALCAKDAAYLEEQAGMEASEREVWLRVGDKKLVYARSLIPVERVRADLRETLDRQNNEPLGRVLGSSRIFFTKDKLEVSVVTCAQASEKLGLAPETPLLARRYILSNRDRDGWVIKAAVTEIFSPEIVSARLLKTG